MKRLSIKPVVIFAVVLALLATSLAPAQAQSSTAPLTLELDLRQLPTGVIPQDGLAYNSFLTISSLDEDAQIIDGGPDYTTGAIGLFPGQVSFEFDADRVQVLSFRYEVFNNNATSTATATGSGGPADHVHPDGASSQLFEDIGDIRRVEMQGLESVVGSIVIEFTGNAPDDDSDGDGVQDHNDNCTVVANANQLDTDEDGFGNHCDTDLNNDNIVNFVDVSRFRMAYFGINGEAPDADFDGDGDIDLDDYEIMKASFLRAPGPSAFG